ncbi:MAG: response regulator [Luteolibacter sp.]|uniref:response regulator n=1 Tax=Luteolibacter sp. TaxID=1962973 RepID=UPI003267D9AB
MRILFVDDEEKSRKYFSMIFGRSWEVVVAGDGAEGLDVVLGEEGRQIGVIVTDQIMPNMTGIEMLERVRHLRPDIIKVLSTAYADSDLAAEAAESGVTDYSVEKPWKIDHVRETLEQAVAAHHRLIGQAK